MSSLQILKIADKFDKNITQRTRRITTTTTKSILRPLLQYLLAVKKEKNQLHLIYLCHPCPDEPLRAFFPNMNWKNEKKKYISGNLIWSGSKSRPTAFYSSWWLSFNSPTTFLDDFVLKLGQFTYSMQWSEIWFDIFNIPLEELLQSSLLIPG